MVIDPGNNLNSTLGKSSSSSSSVRSRQNTSASTPVEKTTHQSGTDNVSLSSKGQTLAKLEAKLSNLPDVDDAKVDKARAAIVSGRYTVDTDAIAEKLMNQDQLF